MLQESLGGKSKTCIIATISPCQISIDESMNTLDYAHRAKNIKNRPQVNEVSSRSGYMKELSAEIQALKRENEVLRTRNGVILPPEQYEQLQLDVRVSKAQILELETVLKLKMSEIDDLQNMYETLETDHEATVEAKLAVETQLVTAQEDVVLAEKAVQKAQLDLQATEYVVQQQVATEAKLTLQASELKQQVQTVVSAKNMLHSKYDYVQEVHANNVAHTEQLVSDTEARFAAMSTHAVEFSDAQLAVISLMQSEAAEFITAKQAKITAMEAWFDEFKQSLTTGKEETLVQQRSIQDAVCTDFVQGMETAHEDIQQSAVAADEKLTSIFKTRLADIQDELTNTSASLTDWNANCVANLKFQKAQLDGFVEQQQDSMSSLQQVLAVQSKKHVLATGEQKDFLNTFHKEQKTQSAALVQALLGNISELVTSFHADSQSQLTDAVEHITGQLDAGLIQYEATATEMQETIGQVQVDTQDWSVLQKQAADDNFSKVSELYTVTAELNKQSIDKVVTVQNGLVAAVAAHSVVRGEQFDTLSSSVATMKTSVETQATAVATSVETCFDTYINTDLKQVEGLVDTLSVAIDTHLSTASNRGSELSVLGDAHTTEQVEHVKQCTATVEQYAHEDFTELEAAGDTPTKQTYAVVDTFAATEPATNLIAEFHASLVEEASTAETDTSTTEDEEGKLSSASDSSFVDTSGVDAENVNPALEGDYTDIVVKEGSSMKSVALAAVAASNGMISTRRSKRTRSRKPSAVDLNTIDAV
jgi:kinesin family protein 11